MNNGKICVSVCAETGIEFIENIKQAAEFADVIELRFDCLQTNEIENAIENLPKIDKPYLATFRPKEQGGKRELSLGERLKFWESLLWANKDKIFWVDFEFDMSFVVNLQKTLTIASSHDFSGVPENLSATYEVFSITNADVLKTAVQANDITDSIAVWKLLERAKKENKQIIPIAMGEAGKWTRILGLAHGAFMTYAALDAESETAPGQVSAGDLIEVYRVKELDENTEVYGILGGNTVYSMSPFVHNAAFKFHNLNAVFVPLQVQNLDAFMRRMVKPETREVELNFKGFSVTIPHKQNIIKHLDYLDETAEKIGAVNTVKIIDGKFYGYNTDAHGFVEPLLNSYGDLGGAKVAVLGAGGAARACVYALKEEGAEVTIFARDLAKAKLLADEFKVNSERFKVQNENYNEFDILVNTTPLGTKGELENQSIAVAGQIESVKLVYDLVYNPFQTRLMTEADKANVPKIGGMAMLIAQAMRQQKIWTGKDAPMRVMSRAILERLR